MATSLRSAALAFVLPSVFFVALAVVVERRAGARWLAPLWALVMCLLLAYAAFGFSHLTGRRAEMLRTMGGMHAMFIAVILIYGVPYALCALAVWRLGVGKRRRAWLQVTVVFVVWLLSVPLAILLGGYTEGLWAK